MAPKLKNRGLANIAGAQVQQDDEIARARLGLRVAPQIEGHVHRDRLSFAAP